MTTPATTNDVVDEADGNESGCVEKNIRSLVTNTKRRCGRRMVVRAVAVSVLVVVCFAQAAVHRFGRYDLLDSKAAKPKTLTKSSEKQEEEEKETAAKTSGRQWLWATAKSKDDGVGVGADDSLNYFEDDYERHDDDDNKVDDIVDNDTNGWYAQFAATHSREWLVGPRLGNVNDMPNSYVKKILARPMSDALLSYVMGEEGQQVHDSKGGASNSDTANRHRRQRQEGLLPMYLSQSMCHPQSRFRDEGSGTTRGRSNSSSNEMADPNDDNIPSDEVKSWTIRLMYLSIMYHQHRYAIPEAKVRYSRHPSNNASRILAQHGVGNFDYECRGAKFIVVSLFKFGLGSAIRAWVVELLMLGLMTDRVVLFVNGAPVGPTPSQEPWVLASCPRGDYQCWFFPASPCSLTHADLESAPWLYRPFLRQLRDGVIPTDHANDKVWQFHEGYLAADAPPLFATERLYNYSKALLRPALMAAANTGSDSTTKTKQKLLRAAAERILQQWEPKSTMHDYDNSNVPMRHALTVFAMRPSFWRAKSLLFASPAARHTPRSPDKKDPWTKLNIDPNNSVGLLIRGTDKCITESECISFQQHLDATSLLLEQYHSDLWQPQRLSSSLTPASSNTTTTTNNNSKTSTPRIDPTLIITTESTAIAHELKQLRANHTALSTLPYRYHLVTNEADVTPNTGFYPDIALAGNGSNVTFTADEAMESVLTTLQHQMLARVTVISCCSTIHKLLADLLQAGCGAFPPPPVHALYCLQAPHVHPRYRVCCEEHPWCYETKRLAVEEWERQQHQHEEGEANEEREKE